MGTRSKIISTIGVLWLAAMAVIAVQTLSTDEIKVDPSFDQEAAIDELVKRCAEEFPGEGAWADYDRLKCSLREGKPDPTVPDYDVAGAATQAAGVSLAAAVLIGATVIWTRPKDEEPVEAVATSTAGAGPPPSAPTLPADPVPTTQPAPVVENDGATVEASLRRLKALHDDGILTDDEYETKRQALTDQL